MPVEALSPELRAAFDAYQAAAAANPHDAVAHSNLAVVLCVAGDYEAALEHARRAVAIDPRLCGAYVNGAVIDGCLSGSAAALPWLDAALGLDPDHLAALLLRATTLAKLGRAEEATAAARRAVALAPENGQTHEILAVALQAAGDYDGALAEYGRAGELSTAGTIGVRKAMLLQEQGRRAEALAVLDGVLALHPQLAAAWFALGLARGDALEPGEIAALHELLATGGNLTLNDRIQLEFTLGGALLKARRIEEAVAQLDAANARKRASIRYDVAADERAIEALIERYAPETFAQLREAGDPSTVPVFVLGMPRSGTTLLEQILASHPAIHGAGELPDVGRLVEAGTPLEPAQLGRAGAAYVAGVVRLAPQAARIVDKMPLNFLHAGFIHAMLPNARIVHVRRDPLDTCFSCYAKLFDQQLGFAYDQDDLGRFYVAYDRLMAHWRSVLPPERFLEVDYEAVVADLEGESRRLIAFCGLEWDARCLAFHQTQRPVLTASVNEVRRPLYASSVGRSRELRPYLGRLVRRLEALGR